MAGKRRQKNIHFGNRDDDIWEAIEKIPVGDQNYLMKEAFRMFFLGQGAKSITPIITPCVKTVQEDEEDHTARIDIDLLTGLIR